MALSLCPSCCVPTCHGSHEDSDPAAWRGLSICISTGTQGPGAPMSTAQKWPCNETKSEGLKTPADPTLERSEVVGLGQGPGTGTFQSCPGHPELSRALQLPEGRALPHHPWPASCLALPCTPRCQGGSQRLKELCLHPSSSSQTVVVSGNPLRPVTKARPLCPLLRALLTGVDGSLVSWTGPCG